MVLVGGGHSHVQVLRSLGMNPLPGARITVIAREVFTPYSGMLPGHVAGRYGWRDLHIDLGPLARFAGARLLTDEVVALDADAQRIELANRPPMHYDLLSINCGAVPARSQRHGVSVKPIGRFLPQWRQIAEYAQPGQGVTVVGGGAGGVELILAMRRALPAEVSLTLLSQRLLPGVTQGAVEALRGAMAGAGIGLQEQFEVVGVDAVDAGESAGEGTQRLTLRAADGRRHDTDYLFWVTGVEAPGWLRHSGLALDDGGFVRVDAQLRSVSHPRVFAAGDVAALMGQERPKSGVYAVRQGPVLSANLRAGVRGGRMRRYRAQRNALAIIGTADGRAVASRGSRWMEGRWVWWWKHRIDRRFMRRFAELPDMAGAAAPPRQVGKDWRNRVPESMRCGGCGAKLGADPLRRVLERLPDQRALEQRQGVTLGIGDDAAVLRTQAGDLVLTIDGFRSLLDDAYLFGRITAHHALNDVIAMGARGSVALAMATVPLMADAMMEDELYLLLKGAVDVLNDHGVPLVGGHSAEGGELALALSLTGTADSLSLGKDGLCDGDELLLTKPLGTGALLAAQMRARLPSDQLAAAVASMDHSNAAALPVLLDHQVTALTDVSGFGLLGHLGEMLRDAGLGATIEAADVPLLPGAAHAIAAGIVSSLQDNNEQALADFTLVGGHPGLTEVRVLVDPQTSGGLLAGVPAGRGRACCEALRAAGYTEAAIIGRVTEGAPQVVLSGGAAGRSGGGSGA